MEWLISGERFGRTVPPVSCPRKRASSSLGIWDLKPEWSRITHPMMTGSPAPRFRVNQSLSHAFWITLFPVVSAQQCERCAASKQPAGKCWEGIICLQRNRRDWEAFSRKDISSLKLVPQADGTPWRGGGTPRL